MAKLLLVDDEESVLRILEEFLSEVGYDIVGTAGTGEEAVEMARSLKPELVLMDVDMPGEMDGIEAAGIMKGIMGIPAIYITGHAGPEYYSRAKYTEPYGFIVKPFGLKEIQANIEIALYRDEVDRRFRA